VLVAIIAAARQRKIRRRFMRRFCLVYIAGFAILVPAGLAPGASTDGPYHLVKTVKVGGVGTFDTACADVEGRKLYIPRKNPGRITVFNLDTLEPAGEIPDAAANGVVVDPESGHGFASSKPVVMWDTKTLKTIKTIDVQGGPDAILFDDFNGHVYIFSHTAPHATVINAADGSVLGTIDLGGMPEQAGVDSAIFNPKTMETYSAQVDGTLTIVKEKSPGSFVAEQTVETKPGAKQMVWDNKTNRILLIAADYGPAPSPAPAGAVAGRGPMVPDSFSVLVVSK
jgi:DNA-binding beta-propeller fold protein YncE